MKNLTLFPMSSYQSKIGGIIFTPIALILLLVERLHGPFMFLSKIAPDRQFDVLFVATVFGMYIIACSKEKNDDERVHLIRAKSLQVAFMLLTGTMIAISMSSTLGKVQAPDSNDLILCSFAAYGIGVYLILFHIGLYFDPSWNYNDDTVIPNIRKNKKFFIIYSIAIAIFFTVVFLIHKA